MIALLGLRYRPTERTDLEAHAARIALLASDVADMPPSLLDRAIAMWVAGSPYLPKASDLWEIARKFIEHNRAETPKGGDRVLAEMNNRCSSPDLRWIRDAGGTLRLMDRDSMDDMNRRNDGGDAA